MGSSFLESPPSEHKSFAHLDSASHRIAALRSDAQPEEGAETLKKNFFKEVLTTVAWV